MSELLEKLKAIQLAINPGPWNEEWMYGAIRHIVRNVDYDCFYTDDEEEDCWTPGRQDGGHIAKLRNLLPEIIAALETEPEPR